MTKKETFEKWFQKVWTEESVAAIHEMFVPDIDGKAKGLKKEEGLGPDEFVAFQKSMLALVKDVKITVESYIEDGDRICLECTFNSMKRNSDTQEPIIMKGCIVGKIVDGKILKANNYFDFLHFFESLRLLPEDTFSTCITGNKI